MGAETPATRRPVSSNGGSSCFYHLTQGDSPSTFHVTIVVGGSGPKATLWETPHRVIEE
jgi:hypothetical protein